MSGTAYNIKGNILLKFIWVKYSFGLIQLLPKTLVILYMEEANFNQQMKVTYELNFYGYSAVYNHIINHKDILDFTYLYYIIHMASPYKAKHEMNEHVLL